MSIDTGDPIRVMVVDDSAVVRGLIARMLEKDSLAVVVASVPNGAVAVSRIGKEDVEVVILDIEMPVMDGLTALPKLLEADPDLRVIMASTLTEKNAEISLRALQAGAADYIPKPSTSRELSGGQDFERDLIEKVKAFGLARRDEKKVAINGDKNKKIVRKTEKAPRLSFSVNLAKPPILIPKPKILAIGSSTGGPQALFEVLKGLQGSLNLPIVITQHMPPTFTKILAEHISRTTGYPSREAVDGDILETGKVYLAPGDYHLTVGKEGTEFVIRLNQKDPENFCRPAVDPMLRSIAEAFGNRALVIILTGMGYDGLKGSKMIKKSGGTVVAQDEESSIVWGMPGAVSDAGICTAVLPIGELAPYVLDYTARASI